MPLIDFKPYGVVKDTVPIDVGDEHYTDSRNIRFREGIAEKMRGELTSFITTEDPLKLQFSGQHDNPFWFYMSDDGVRVTDFAVDLDLDVANTIIAGGDWDSTLFNQIGVFNNTKQAPVFSNGADQVATLPGFPLNTLTNAIRPFRSFLVALNLTDTGNTQPNRVLWSDQADGGALPPNWDIANPATLSGDVYLTETRGEIIDGLALRDFFVIYKTHSMVLMSLVGGQQVMNFQRTHINSGILAKDCVVEFKGRHFVLADGDIVLFDGQNIESVVEDTVRAEIFGNIDKEHFANAYVRRSDIFKEIWVCYPETGQEFPNRAAIWNWEDNTWTFRDIGVAPDIAQGLTNFTSSPTYDSMAGITYDSQAGVLYDNPSESPTVDVMAKASSFAINNLDATNNIDGQPFLSVLEKASMHFGTPERVKIVNKVLPRITGLTGSTVHIRIGTQMNPDDAIAWQPEQQFIVGVDREVSVTGKGRFISIRFRTDTIDIFYKLHGFQIDAQEAGRF